ncbi:Nuclear pore complex protein [Smittium mucronatum]|uniref:Nuclear pore complex protein n=1 Tax=Smittium mucronatum TaxID=133383 RepID=A0A1R0H2Y3_9FUNG|nr:Nuclear pore complex protein [Smittium mucronatum]
MNEPDNFHELLEDWDTDSALLFCQIEDISNLKSINLIKENPDYSFFDSKAIDDDSENIVLKKIKGYIGICDSRIKYFKSFEGIQSHPSENSNLVEKWLLEKNTWKLLHSMFSLRIQNNVSFSPLNDSQNSEIDFSPVDSLLTDFSKVLKIFSLDFGLSEYSAIKNWLEEIAPPFHSVEIRTGYWPFTRKEYERSLRKNEKRSDLVTQLDPDAPTRLQKRLAPEDLEYERFMLKSLYEFVRRGRLNDAIMLCINNGEPWRAASLRGGTYFYDSGIDNTNLINDKSVSVATGNINRRLWKEMCSVLASDPKVDIYERALYGVLSGRLDEAFSVCETWEDRVWVEICAMIEKRIEEILIKRTGIYKPSSLSGIGTSDQRNAISDSLLEMFEKIKSESNIEITNSAYNPFREVQVAITTKTLNQYIISFSKNVRKTGISTTDPHFIRFLVHLILVSREIGMPLDEFAGDTIISAYVQILSTSPSHKTLVAMYCSKLPGSIPIELYSGFLANCDSVIEERAIYIQLAEQYNLDVISIVKKTALNILEKYSYISDGDMTSHITKFSGIDDPLNKAEIIQIRAIEWLIFYHELYTYSLIHIVSLARRFLIFGRVNAAISLFNSLPNDFVQSSWKNIAIQENEDAENESNNKYESWGQYLKKSNPEYDSYDKSKDTIDQDQEYAISEDLEVQSWPTVIISTSFDEYIQLISLCDGISHYTNWLIQMDNIPSENQRVPVSKVEEIEWMRDSVYLTDETEGILRNKILEIDWLGDSVKLLENDNIQVSDNSKNVSNELLSKSEMYPDGRMNDFILLINQTCMEILRKSQENIGADKSHSQTIEPWLKNFGLN